MYKESQTKLHQAESQIISLQTEIKKISTSSTTKVTTITSSSSKADDFSIEREKWIKERQNLETEVNEIKNHLIGAETYIRQLEQQLETLNKQYIISKYYSIQSKPSTSPSLKKTMTFIKLYFKPRSTSAKWKRRSQNPSTDDYVKIHPFTNIIPTNQCFILSLVTASDVKQASILNLKSSC